MLGWQKTIECGKSTEKSDKANDINGYFNALYNKLTVQFF